LFKYPPLVRGRKSACVPKMVSEFFHTAKRQDRIKYFGV
jgi:hypothetical protein